MSRVLPFGVSERGKRASSIGLIGGMGILLAGFEVWHTTQMPSLSGKFFMAVLPLIAALVIIYSGYRVAQSEATGSESLRIAGWFLAGMAGMAIVAVWIVGHQFIRGVGFHHWHFMTTGSMTVGGIVGLLLGGYDVRNRRQRQQVNEERRKVEAEQEKLTLLNRVLRHNILNSVNVIRGRAETHKDRSETADHSDLDIVVSRSNDIVNLIDKVHTFIERISHNGNPELKPVDLSTSLQHEIEKCRNTYPNASIVGDLQGDIWVAADEMLEELFENLLMNAVEHNDKDEPTVTVTMEGQERVVIVNIADNGPGIPDNQRDQLFEWNPESTSRPATGVGLSLVGTLVDQYGGSIWVEENEPNGSIFRVQLRRSHASPQATLS